MCLEILSRVRLLVRSAVMEITDLFCSDLLDACSSEIYFEVLEVLQKYFGNSRVRCLYNRLREVAWLDGLNVF